jgi:hypothetical protein
MFGTCVGDRRRQVGLVLALVPVPRMCMLHAAQIPISRPLVSPNLRGYRYPHAAVAFTSRGKALFLQKAGVADVVSTAWGISFGPVIYSARSALWLECRSGAGKNTQARRRTFSDKACRRSTGTWPKSEIASMWRSRARLIRQSPFPIAVSDSPG